MTRSERAIYALVEALLDVGVPVGEVRAGIKTVAKQIGIEPAIERPMRTPTFVAERGW